jgi:hypothetical protein
MLIIDENISELEVWRLRESGIAVRQIGTEITKLGVTDENIIAVLHQLKRPTFFTRDRDFWSSQLVHRGYCLVFLDLQEHEGEIAAAIRKFLKHPAFGTHSRRLGKVIRLHPDRIAYWQKGKRGLQSVAWESR